MNTMTEKTTGELWDLVAGLSEPSKMPCHGYSISAKRCITGSKLAKVEGSICSKCYACHGNYGYDSVQACLERRYAALPREDWIENMVELIGRKEKSGFFRWHDSGDLQGLWHLVKIVEVCRRTPGIRHWLPTREYAVVAEYKRTIGDFPKNLTIRLSAMMFNGPTPDRIALDLGVQVSGASNDGGFTCPAPKQRNKCGSCRACWKQSVFKVIYKQH